MPIQKVEKTIIVRSFGLKHRKHFPEIPAPDAKTMFFMTDVRFVPDPCQDIDEAGDGGKVYEIIINRPEMNNFLLTETTLIHQRIMQFKLNANFSALELNYFCYAGYHRSPAIATWARDQIRLMGWEKPGHILRLEHLTLHLRKKE